MEEINLLLAKYFLGKTNLEENIIINDFAQQNPAEYAKLLKAFDDKKVNLHDFDIKKGWEKVNQKIDARDKKTSIRTLFLQYRKFAAIALVLIAASYFVFNYNSSNELNFIEFTNNELTAISVELNDGSSVWLNKNATLSYPKQFEEDTRSVKLSGEAYFEIEKNPNKPFIVETNNVKIKVLGTSFNVNQKVDETMISVNSGLVEVRNKNNDTEQIEKGNQAIIHSNGIEKSSINNPNYLAWKTGVFTFKNTPISKVLTDLNQFYSNRISFSGTNSGCQLTAQFNNKNLSEIAEIIELSCNVSLKIIP